MVIFLMFSLFALLFLGVPIFMSLSLSSIMSLALFTPIEIGVMIQRFFGGLDKFGLMAMPLFIFGAEIMLRGGIARKLLDVTKFLVAKLPGGTALTAHVACMFFGALCGSSPATVAAIGGVMYPELREDKYAEGFSVGLISSSAAVALLIPPSVTMILYGVATGVSIGALFVGGIGAGITYTIVLSIYILFWANKNKHIIKQVQPSGSFGQTLFSAIPALGIPVLILGGIYSGIFSPTEAAGVSTIYSILVSLFVYKTLTLQILWDAAKKSAVTCAQVLILTSAAATFGWLLTVGRVPQMLADSFLSSGASEFMFLMFVNVIFITAGCFMDGSGAVTILAPIIYPLGVVMKVDPILLGVIITTNLAIGNMTPPLGLNLFVANGVTNVPMTTIIKSIIPFFLMSLIALMIITFVPEITLFLVNKVY